MTVTLQNLIAQGVVKKGLLGHYFFNMECSKETLILATMWLMEDVALGNITYTTDRMGLPLWSPKN